MIETVGDLIRALQEFDPCKQVRGEPPENEMFDPDFVMFDIECVDHDEFGNAILVGDEWRAVTRR